MKKLLYTTTAFVLCGGIVQANAACIATPTCSSLGYTSSSSCDGGLKCPFGKAWNCSINEIKTEITEIKNIIEQQQENNAKSCVVGNIFYSDLSCSVFLNSDKTPIGVVVYTDGQGHGQVLALDIIGNYTWGPSGDDIPTLPALSRAQEAINDLGSCGNTKKITAAGNKSKYPAAWAAQEYKTAGTEAGDWCLPAAGIAYLIFTEVEDINKGLINAGSTVLLSNRDEFWTSTEKNTSGEAWIFFYDQLNTGALYGIEDRLKTSKYDVRPVLEF